MAGRWMAGILWQPSTLLVLVAAAVLYHNSAIPEGFENNTGSNPF